jgi:hypothetical protein
MDDAFLLKTITSFVAAGVWIGGFTLLAERLGSKKGGLICNLPSTIMMALIFVALVQDARFAAAATDAVPIGMLIDTLFLLIFILLLKHGLIKAVLLSLFSWFILAFLAQKIHSSDIVLNIILYFITAAAAYLLLEYGVKIPAKGSSRKKYSPGSLLLRIIFAGSVVAGTTIISTFAGTYWVGLFSTFPAVMVSTMVILTLNQGADFAMATGKVMILSSTNIIIYALGVSITYPGIGMVFGTIVSFGMAFLWVLLLHPVIQRVSREKREK